MKVGRLASVITVLGLVTVMGAGNAEGRRCWWNRCRPAPTTTTVVRPTTTIAPVNGIRIAAGDNIQAAVDAYEPGTRFVLAAGVYREQSIRPKSGDSFVGQAGTVLSGARVLTGWTRSPSGWTVGGQSQDQGRYGECQDAHPWCGQSEEVFVDGNLLAPERWHFDHTAQTITVFDDPTGHLVETSVTAKAFSGLADDVTIQNLTIEQYATPNQNGTIQAGPRPGGLPDGGRNWLLQDLTVRRNHGVGIAMGDGTVVRRVTVINNGNLGIVGTSASGGIVDSSQILGNNTSGVNSGWSAGGAKWAGSYNNLTVTNTVASGNDGPGLWVDESCVNTTFTHNTVDNNTTSGIAVEISYGALIQGNTLRGNGFARSTDWLWGSAIEIAGSPNVEVTGNTVTANNNAISGIQQARGSGLLGPHLLTGLNVHDNIINLGTGGTGIVDDTGANLVFSGTNHFTHNTYSGGHPSPYAWNNRWNTATEWTATGNS